MVLNKNKRQLRLPGVSYGEPPKDICAACYQPVDTDKNRPSYALLITGKHGGQTITIKRNSNSTLWFTKNLLYWKFLSSAQKKGLDQAGVDIKKLLVKAGYQTMWAPVHRSKTSRTIYMDNYLFVPDTKKLKRELAYLLSLSGGLLSKDKIKILFLDFVKKEREKAI